MDVSEASRAGTRMAEVDSSFDPNAPDAARLDPLKERVLNGRFRILEPIGAGGMGRVYKAIQTPLDRLVAVKVLHPQYSSRDQGFVKRFVLEASLTSKLRHPNTVTVIDYGQTEDGVFFIAMEYLEGSTVAEVLSREGALSWGRTLHIGQQVARSLREAHKFGIIHRDLKPANVMLLDEADNDQIKVLDFGLVKSFVPEADSAASEADGQKITQAGMLLGSPQYMAPEQARNHSDPRSDVYSFGVLLYEMIIGRPPFVAKDYIEVIVKHMKEAPPPFRLMRPELQVPSSVEALVMRCLAKEASARFQSMDEVLEGMRALSGTPVGVSGPRTGAYGVVAAAGSLSASGERRGVATPTPRAPTGTLLMEVGAGDSFPVDVSTDFSDSGGSGPRMQPGSGSGPYVQPGSSSGQYVQPGSGSGQYAQPGSGPYAQPGPRPPSGPYPQPGSGAYAQPPGGYPVGRPPSGQYPQQSPQNARPPSGPQVVPPGGYPVGRPPSGPYSQSPVPGSGPYPQPGSGAYAQPPGGYPVGRPPSGQYPQQAVSSSGLRPGPGPYSQVPAQASLEAGGVGPGAMVPPLAQSQVAMTSEAFAVSSKRESQGGKGAWIALVLLLLLIGGGAAWWFGFREKAPAQPVVAVVEPKPEPRPGAEVPAPKPEVVPGVGKRVRFKVTSDPSGAHVFMGAKELGTTPLTFEMPAQGDGTATAELVFSADGYLTLGVTAGGSGDVVLSQRLQKRGGGGGSASSGGSRSSGGSSGSSGGGQAASSGFDGRIDAPTMMVADPKAAPKGESPGVAAAAAAAEKPAAARVGAEILPFGEGMSRPEQTSGSSIQYTREAIAAKVEGLMIVKCVINTSGHVENCRVLKSLPYMDKAVLDSLYSRSFKPITYQGRAVSVDYVFDVRLVLPKR